MTMDAINEEHGSDWSHEVSIVATTRDGCSMTRPFLSLRIKGVACETRCYAQKPAIT